MKTFSRRCGKAEKLGFQNWLQRQVYRDDPVGDLAQDMLKDPAWPQTNDLAVLRPYVIERIGTLGVSAALEEAYLQWQRYRRDRVGFCQQCGCPGHARKRLPRSKEALERSLQRPPGVTLH